MSRALSSRRSPHYNDFLNAAENCANAFPHGRLVLYYRCSILDVHAFPVAAASHMGAAKCSARAERHVGAITDCSFAGNASRLISSVAISSV